MKPIIPPELWIEIIDNLHDDKSTLCKCGLVCRFWLWSSRSHLFYTLVLTLLNIDTALSVLCAPGSTIPPHVRALEIEGSLSREFQPSWVSVLSKLPQLSAVETLSLSHVGWNILTDEAKERLFTISRGLKSLTLECMTFDTLGHALPLICSAPSLECLSLGHMRCRSKDKSLSEFSGPPIQRLIFTQHGKAPILNWLCHWQPTPSVRSLTFYGINLAEIAPISAFIRRVGPALEHLELVSTNFRRGETQAALRKEIHLMHSTSLKTILIDNLVLYKNSLKSRTYDWIIDILSQITSRFIERVTLVITLNTPQELVPFNLPALAALFAHGSPTFSELSTRLQFGFYGAVDRAEARAAITESLRELHSQGRLEFAEGRIGMTQI